MGWRSSYTDNIWPTGRSLSAGWKHRPGWMVGWLGSWVESQSNHGKLTKCKNRHTGHPIKCQCIKMIEELNMAVFIHVRLSETIFRGTALILGVLLHMWNGLFMVFCPSKGTSVRLLNYLKWCHSASVGAKNYELTTTVACSLAATELLWLSCIVSNVSARF